MKDTTIHVATVLDKFEGIDAEDGQKVYDLIIKAFFQSKKVILAFDNMEMLSEEFLQTAVGQLYENYSHADIKKNMRIENILFSGKIALKRVVDRAKEIY
ncbi:MAG TPA: STAS-like domain-containing protein [Dysgonamonadaceae bacterium]|nr:STAS-like domain-containing protein [Dysgonamonadaceae bacterium]